MMDIGRILETVVSNVLTPTVVSAIVAPLVFYALKRRDEKRSRLADRRYEAYRSYLKTLEAINEALRNDLQVFTLERLPAHLTELFRGNDPEPLVQDCNEFFGKVLLTFARAKGDLYGLRLVCSDEVLALVQEYTALNEDLLHRTGDLFENLKSGRLVTDEFNALAARADSIQQTLLAQMRKELAAA